jgi:hypothetical protein
MKQEPKSKMQKATLKFHGIDLITDERKVIGIIAQEDYSKDFFASYEPIRVEDFKLCLKNCRKEEKKGKELVLSHLDLISSFTRVVRRSASVLGKKFQSPRVCSKRKAQSISLQSGRNGEKLQWMCIYHSTVYLLKRISLTLCPCKNPVGTLRI